MKYIGAFLIAFAALSCSSHPVAPAMPVQQLPVQQPERDTAEGAEPDRQPAFTDSLQTAVPGSYKIELTATPPIDGAPSVSLHFYRRSPSGWRLRQSRACEQWSDGIGEPEIADFNGDGYNDILYEKGIGGRGSNVFMNLFIYDPKADSLIYVENADEFPNLYYNEPTRSVNSYGISGSYATTHFMHVRSSRLVPFASIVQNDEDNKVTVHEYDRSGKIHSIRIDSSGRFEPYARFVNYKPPRANGSAGAE